MQWRGYRGAFCEKLPEASPMSDRVNACGFKTDPPLAKADPVPVSNHGSASGIRQGLYAGVWKNVMNPSPEEEGAAEITCDGLTMTFIPHPRAPLQGGVTELGSKDLAAFAGQMNHLVLPGFHYVCTQPNLVMVEEETLKDFKENAEIYLQPELYEFCLGVLEMILKFRRMVDYIHKTRVPLTFQHKRIDVNHGPETHLKEHSGNT
ncbi:hypothetical protein WISP_123467 [Willisornis vidua]|uniref:Uncharacterized protein n=1 Tax=Willisornis vidua TaxID=1566151 RepID=A0ABQ9CS25_9PASS|nr:hypothetical protein WISP_123467 [Willisornis vidua]